MSENVVDAVGPVLQRIQAQLNRLEEKFDVLTARMEPRVTTTEKTLSNLVLRHRYAIGAVSDMDAKMQDFEAELTALAQRTSDLETR